MKDISRSYSNMTLRYLQHRGIQFTQRAETPSIRKVRRLPRLPSQRHKRILFNTITQHTLGDDQRIPACVLSHFCRVRLFAIPWTVAHQAPLSMGFSRQEYWSRLPCPPAGDLHDAGIERASLTSPAFSGGFFTTRATWEAPKASM